MESQGIGLSLGLEEPRKLRSYDRMSKVKFDPVRNTVHRESLREALRRIGEEKRKEAANKNRGLAVVLERETGQLEVGRRSYSAKYDREHVAATRSLREYIACQEALKIAEQLHSQLKNPFYLGRYGTAGLKQSLKPIIQEKIQELITGEMRRITQAKERLQEHAAKEKQRPTKIPEFLVTLKRLSYEPTSFEPRLTSMAMYRAQLAKASRKSSATANTIAVSAALDHDTDTLPLVAESVLDQTELIEQCDELQADCEEDTPRSGTLPELQQEGTNGTDTCCSLDNTAQLRSISPGQPRGELTMWPDSDRPMGPCARGREEETSIRAEALSRYNTVLSGRKSPLGLLPKTVPRPLKESSNAPPKTEEVRDEVGGNTQPVQANTQISQRKGLSESKFNTAVPAAQKLTTKTGAPKWQRSNSHMPGTHVIRGRSRVVAELLARGKTREEMAEQQSRRKGLLRQLYSW